MSQPTPPTTPSLIDGVADAIGFVGGALAGFWLGQLAGLDIFAPGYGTTALLGIALVGLGGGLGLHAARRWQQQRRQKLQADQQQAQQSQQQQPPAKKKK
jgi:predicted lipid-binding transport protein (Tim44 family)